MKNKKLIIAILVILTISLVTFFSTYALWKYVSNKNANINTVTPGLDYYINYTKGQNIESSILNISSTYENGTNTTIELWKKDNTYDLYGHLYLNVNNISELLSTEKALKWTLVSNDEVLSSGTLNGSKSGDIIPLKSNIPLSLEKQLFTIYIWLDESIEITNNISGEPLELSVSAEVTMKEIIT